MHGIPKDILIFGFASFILEFPVMELLLDLQLMKMEL
jgi:hypothetical protein